VAALLIVLCIAPGTAAGEGMLLLAYMFPAIVMVMVIASTPQAECPVIQCMVIHAGIVAVSEVYAVVSTDIRVVTCGGAEVEVVAVGIAIPDTHTPRVTYHIYGAVEVVALHKPAVLAVAEHIHEVFVAHVEQVVVIVDGIVVSVHHIVYHLIHLIEEVEVDFIHIVVLTVRESEFMSHTVCKEACLATDIG